MSSKQQRQSNLVITFLYILIALSVIGYALWNSMILGAMAFALVVITLIAEFRNSINQEGARKTVYEIAVALIVVVVLFFVIGLILGTRTPIDVVASCSMLPALHRGDLVVLHGISNMTAFLSSRNIPVVNVSPSEMNYTLANMGKESLAFFAYNPSNRSNLGEITNLTQFPVGLYNTRCLDTYSYLGEQQNYYRCFVGNVQNGLIKYNYSVGRINVSGRISNIVQTSGIIIGNTPISENYSNPIIVYQTTSNDTFSGDIIHRLYAAIKSGSSYYLLTKGDNNGGLDIQFGNYPISQNYTIGYVIGQLPVLGYLKLIISGQLSQPTGCNSTILR